MNRGRIAWNRLSCNALARTLHLPAWPGGSGEAPWNFDWRRAKGEFRSPNRHAALNTSGLGTARGEAWARRKRLSIVRTDPFCDHKHPPKMFTCVAFDQSEFPVSVQNSEASFQMPRSKDRGAWTIAGRDRTSSKSSKKTHTDWWPQECRSSWSDLRNVAGSRLRTNSASGLGQRVWP